MKKWSSKDSVFHQLILKIARKGENNIFERIVWSDNRIADIATDSWREVIHIEIFAVLVLFKIHVLFYLLYFI